jgi:outer membrane biosynthesis protein TonB
MSLGGGGGNDVAKGPKVIHHTEVQWARQSPLPRYPSAAKSMNLGDQNCKVRLFLDAKGFVTDLEFVQCNPVFHEACRTAMTRWKAFPVRAAGRKVATQFVMNVKFKLR